MLHDRYKYNLFHVAKWYMNHVLSVSILCSNTCSICQCLATETFVIELICDHRVI